MSPRRCAWLLASARVALGLAVLAAPSRVTAHWLGEENARRRIVVYLARSLGVRDLALGLATLQTLDDAVIGPRLQAACAAVDGVDALATLLAASQLPRKGLFGTVLLAGCASAAGFYASHRLAHE
jgi:hypothetical protein